MKTCATVTLRLLLPNSSNLLSFSPTLFKTLKRRGWIGVDEMMKWGCFCKPSRLCEGMSVRSAMKKRFPLHSLKPHSSRLLNCPRDTISPTIYHWLSVKTPPCSWGSSDACLLLLTVCVYIQQEFPALTVWGFRWSFLSLPGWFCLALRRSDYIKPLRELYRSWTSLCVCLVCLY